MKLKGIRQVSCERIIKRDDKKKIVRGNVVYAAFLSYYFIFDKYIYFSTFTYVFSTFSFGIKAIIVLLRLFYQKIDKSVIVDL